MNIGKTGKSGESRVADFLRNKGCTVIKRNYQSKYGEIDIIAQSGDKILFVEVKTRKENSMVSGLEAVDIKKRHRILLTANDFIVKTECRLQPRFDVAEVTVSENGRELEKYLLNYIKNAF